MVEHSVSFNGSCKPVCVNIELSLYKQFDIFVQSCYIEIHYGGENIPDFMGWEELSPVCFSHGTCINYTY